MLAEYKTIADLATTRAFFAEKNYNGAQRLISDALYRQRWHEILDSFESQSSGIKAKSS